MFKYKRYVNINNIPQKVKYCLVLGAHLGENRSLTPILLLRLRLVELLSQKREDMIFFISGDLEDSSVMFKYLTEISKIPEERLILDHFGRNTYWSVTDIFVRYGIRCFAILTSSFHIFRATFIARCLGANAYAIDIREYELVKKNPYLKREILAMGKAALYIIREYSGYNKLKHYYREKKFLREFVYHSNPKDISFVEEILMQAYIDNPVSCPIIYFSEKLSGLEMKMDIIRNIEPEQLIVKPRHQDCTSFIEYLIAFTMCFRKRWTRYNDFCHCVKLVRYRDGIIDGYVSRNHYFSWSIENGIRQKFLQEIVTEGFPFTEHFSSSFDYMSVHYFAYPPLERHPELISDIKRREAEFSCRTWPYITRENLKDDSYNWEKLIRDGDILALTADQHSWARGLDIKHLIVAKWLDHNLYFYHSSRGQTRLSDKTLNEYLANMLSMSGIRIIRFIGN